MAYKFAIFFALACVLSLSIVDSCNSNSGTGSSSSCSSGKKGSECSASCKCAANSSLSCIDGTCACGSNSWNKPCSSECGCDTSAGLVCNSGVCECKNTTAELWDDGICAALTSSVCNTNIIQINDKKFVDDAQAKAWRCNWAKLKLYSPSFNGTSRIGTYTYHQTTRGTAVEGRNYCQAQNMKLVMSQPDQDFADFIKNAPSVLIIGVSLNSKDNKYYHDNGKEFTETFANPDDTLPCVNVIKTPSLTDPPAYNKVACNFPASFICAHY